MTEDPTTTETHAKPVLDYGKAARQPLSGRYLKSPLAVAAAVAAVAIVAMVLDRQHHGRGEPLIIPLFLLTIWYLRLRAVPSRSPRLSDITKLICSVWALMMFLHMSSGIVSPFDYARAYGWTDRLAFGNFETLSLALALGIFMLLDLANLLCRYRKPPRRVSPLNAPPPS